jgi:hypothetical protein
VDRVAPYFCFLISSTSFSRAATRFFSVWTSWPAQELNCSNACVAHFLNWSNSFLRLSLMHRCCALAPGPCKPFLTRRLALAQRFRAGRYQVEVFSGENPSATPSQLEHQSKPRRSPLDAGRAADPAGCPDTFSPRIVAGEAERLTISQTDLICQIICQIACLGCFSPHAVARQKQVSRERQPRQPTAIKANKHRLILSLTKGYAWAKMSPAARVAQG